jgi:hypothetical protein
MKDDDQTSKTAAYLAGRDKLPEELWSDYDSLVKWYRFYATIHQAHPFVNYRILADLVRAGWRLSAEPLDGAD